MAPEPQTGPVSVEIMISIELTMEGSHFDPKKGCGNHMGGKGGELRSTDRELGVT